MPLSFSAVALLLAARTPFATAVASFTQLYSPPLPCQVPSDCEKLLVFQPSHYQVIKAALIRDKI